MFENKDKEACGINNVEETLFDGDVEYEPDDFNEKYIELNDSVAIEMFDLEATNLGDDDELPAFGTTGMEDVNDKSIGNENEGACDINDVEVVLLDADGEIEPDDFNEKCFGLDDFAAIEIFDFETTVLSDENELPVSKTIRLEDVNDRLIENEDEEPCGINDVKAAVLDSDAKMEPDNFNEKFIEFDDFVVMEMFDLETTDFGNDDEFPVSEIIGLEDINDKRIENEDGEVCSISDVEVALLDVDGEIEPDDFNEKCIEIDDFVATEMFDLETTVLGDIKLPVFETVLLEDVIDNSIENEDGEAYGINDIEAVVLDSDGKMEPDDFNEKCIELDDFVAMEIFDLETTNLGGDDELLLFEATGLEEVNVKRIENEDEEACGINDVVLALLDTDGKIEPDDCNDKCIELDGFVAIEMFDLETANLADDDDELTLFEVIGLEDINGKRIENDDEEVRGINNVEV